MSHAPRLGELTRARSWGELLVERAHESSAPIRFVNDFRPGFTSRPEVSEQVTREQLLEAAGRAATLLFENGVRPGDRVILQLPGARDFVTHFFACQLLGAIAVPVVPPWALTKMEGQVQRVLELARIAEPKVAVVGDAVRASLLAFAGRQGQALLGRLVGPNEHRDASPLRSPHRARGDDAALVQFTSGSTSTPRGVTLTHDNLLANCHAIGAELEFFGRPHVGCSWLPLFHDMGLIGHVLVPLLWSIETVLLPPQSFALRPQSWLEAISGYQASISSAPNFAYQFVSRRLTNEEVETLNLSAWTVALCGGEPVLPETLDAFARRLAPAGFDRRALCPVYGLAESTLAVTLSAPDAPPLLESVDRERFVRSGKAVLVGANAQAMSWVSSGKALPGHRIAIYDDSGRALPDGHEGQIAQWGPSVMARYFQDPAATERSLANGWLLTGDRGYLRNGQLFVTGRDKELIIKGGRNIYPHEVEAAASRVEGLRAGRIAAVGVPSEDGTESLVVIAEVRAGLDRAAAERAIHNAVLETVGVRPDVVSLLPPGSLEKTSSGKLRRLDASRRFVEGRWGPAPSPLLTRARLTVARALVLASRGVRR